MALEHVRDLLLEVVKLKRRQEAKRTQMERHHRWDGLLEQKGGVQQRAITAQTDNEIDLVRQVVPTISEKMKEN